MSNSMMSAGELRELKQMCNDPFLELGMSLRPKHLDCFKSRMVTQYIRTTILFETHEDAQKWNNMHKDRIREQKIVTLAEGQI